MNESFWDAHGVDIGACAFFSIFLHFSNPSKNVRFDGRGARDGGGPGRPQGAYVLAFEVPRKE